MTFLKNNKVAFIQLGVWLLLLGLNVLIGKFEFGYVFYNSIQSLFARYGFLALAMIATVKTSAGLNFGLPIGYLCGHTAVIFATARDLAGIGWLLMSLAIALVSASIVGFCYGKLITKIKGSGGTNVMLTFFMGIAVAPIMNFIYLILRFKNSEVMLPRGIGLRNQIMLPGGIIGNFLSFKVGSITMPVGLILIFAVVSFIVWYFLLREKRVAVTVDRSKYTVIAAMISTAIGAIAAIIYAQNTGIIITYSASAHTLHIATAVLLGGATLKKAGIRQAIMGVLLFSALSMFLGMPLIQLIGNQELRGYMQVAIIYLIPVCALLRLLWWRKVDGEI